MRILLSSVPYLRDRILAVEVLGILSELDYDASIIVPAFPAEMRTTVGGYHLLKGIPIERTEMARDPHSPIYESHLPTLLQSQLGENLKNLVGSIELKTILHYFYKKLNKQQKEEFLTLFLPLKSLIFLHQLKCQAKTSREITKYLPNSSIVSFRPIMIMA